MLKCMYMGINLHTYDYSGSVIYVLIWNTNSYISGCLISKIDVIYISYEEEEIVN